MPVQNNEIYSQWSKCVFLFVLLYNLISSYYGFVFLDALPVTKYMFPSILSFHDKGNFDNDYENATLDFIDFIL